MSPDELKKRSILVRGKSQIQRTTVPIKTRRPKNAVEVESHQEMSSDFFDFEKEVSDIKSASEQFQEVERLAKAEEERKSKEKEAQDKILKEKLAPTTIAESSVILEERLQVFQPVEMEEGEIEASVQSFTQEDLSVEFYDILEGKKEEVKPQDEFFIHSLEPSIFVLEETGEEEVEVKKDIVQQKVQEEVQEIFTQPKTLIQQPPEPIKDEKPKIQDKRKPKIIDFSEPTEAPVEILKVLENQLKPKKKVIDFSNDRDLSDDGSDEIPEVEIKPEPEKKEVAEEKPSQKTCLFMKPNGERCKRPAPKNNDYCAAHRKALNLGK